MKEIKADAKGKNNVYTRFIIQIDILKFYEGKINIRIYCSVQYNQSNLVCFRIASHSRHSQQKVMSRSEHFTTISY